MLCTHPLFARTTMLLIPPPKNPGQTREPFWASSLEHIVSVSAPRCLFKFMPIDLMSLCEEIADDNKPNFQMFINMFLCQYICIHTYIYIGPSVNIRTSLYMYVCISNAKLTMLMRRLKGRDGDGIRTRNTYLSGGLRRVSVYKWKNSFRPKCALRRLFYYCCKTPKTYTFIYTYKYQHSHAVTLTT